MNDLTKYNITISDEVVFPNSIEEIDANDDLNNLIYGAEKISFTPKSKLKKIGAKTFVEMHNLVTLCLPPSLEVFDENAIDYCKFLEDIIVHEDNPNYLSKEGILYSKDGKTLIKYPSGRTDTYFIVPNEVVCIASNAFEHNGYLINVIFQEESNCERIEKRAFMNLTHLTTINLPRKLNFISSENFFDTRLCTMDVNDSNRKFFFEREDGHGILIDYINKEVICVSKATYIEEIVLKDARKIAEYALNYTNIRGIIDCSKSIVDYNQLSLNHRTSCKMLSYNENIFAEKGNFIYDITQRKAVSFQNERDEMTIMNGTWILGKGLFSTAFVKKVTLPKSLVKCESKAFSHNKKAYVEMIKYKGTIEQWLNIDFEDYDAFPLTNEGYLVINEEVVDTITIPDGTTTIKKYTIASRKFREINIPSSVKVIERMVDEPLKIGLEYVTNINFYGNFDDWLDLDIESIWPYSIRLSLEVGEGLPSIKREVIKKNTFAHMCNIDYIVVDKCLKKIERNAFKGCTSFSIDYNGTVEDWQNIINEDDSRNLNTSIVVLFQNEAINKITIDRENIYPNTFKYLFQLEEITLSRKVKKIGRYAFYRCLNIQKVYFEGTLEEWLDIDFEEKYSNPLIYGADLYIQGERLEHLIIPKEVNYIKKNCFAGCLSIMEVTIDHIVEISHNAFLNCPFLVKLNSKQTFLSQEIDTVKNGDFQLIKKDDMAVLKYDSVQFLLRYLGNNQSFALPKDIDNIYEMAFYRHYQLYHLEINKMFEREVFDNSLFIRDIINHADDGYYIKEALDEHTTLFLNEALYNQDKVVLLNDYGFIYLAIRNVRIYLDYLGTDYEVVLPRDYDIRICRNAFIRNTHLHRLIAYNNVVFCSRSLENCGCLKEILYYGEKKRLLSSCGIINSNIKVEYPYD